MKMKNQSLALIGALMAIVVWIAPAGAVTIKVKKHVHHRHLAHPVRVTQRLYCEYKVPGQPRAFLIYDPHTATVWTRTGYPPRTRVFAHPPITTYTGFPPYGYDGFSIVAFGDAFLAHVSYRDVPLAKLDPLVAFFKAIFDPQLASTWGLLNPGGPGGVLNAGECDVGQPNLFRYHDFINW